MKVHLDKEDELYLIPTIVVCKYKSINAMSIHLTFLKWSIAFILKFSGGIKC